MVAELNDREAALTVKPEPILCPECEAPAVDEQAVPVTAMYFAPFFDEQGRRHVHGSNGSGVLWTCKNGHSWSPPGRKCWCGE